MTRLRDAALAALAAVASAAALTACGPAPAPTVADRPAEASVAPGGPAAPPDPALVARGAYLAKLGNCAGCHTAPGGPPMAGGRRLETPYGAVHAGNLTPDPATGLGRWTADDFYRALHQGRSPDGRRYLPAFPFTAYTHVAREDSDALYAWLRSLAAVEQPNRPHELRFPYGTPVAMAAWHALNFAPAEPRARAPTAGVERGAYLVRGLGHCAECHAPRGRGSAPGDRLIGAEMVLPGERWWAPSLHPVAGAPIDPAQTVALLRDGIAAHGTVGGPMAVIVRDSTQHWTPADLQAVAEYLHRLPPTPAPAPAVRAEPAVRELGERLYAERCLDCHGAEGRGLPGVYPPLAGNPSVVQPNIVNLVRVLRHGGFPAATAGHPLPHGMPPSELNDEQTAAVLTYLRQSWGHRAAAVQALDVLQAR